MRWLRKSTDVGQIYDSCMDYSAGFKLSATEVSMAHASPFALFCKYHADPAKEGSAGSVSAGAFDKGSRARGRSVRIELSRDGKSIVRNAGGRFHAGTPFHGSRFQSIVKLPDVYLPEGMYGYADVLEKRNGESVWGNHHYVVREIKVARNVKEPHLLQTAFYTLMLGRIQQYVRNIFSLPTEMETRSNTRTRNTRIS